MNDSRKRIVLPEKRVQAGLAISPHDVTVESIMEDAIQTAAIEIAKFRVKVGRGNSLDLKESRILQGWIESLLKLKKEQRESDRESDLNKLSQEELIALAKKVLNEGPSIIELPSDNESTD